MNSFLIPVNAALKRIKIRYRKSQTRFYYSRQLSYTYWWCVRQPLLFVGQLNVLTHM